MGSLEDDVPRGRYILFKPVAENFTDPLMPLTEDILLDLMPMMKVIHGRVYVHFDHVRALIPLKMSDDDIARLAYLSAPLDNKLRISIPRLLLVASIVFFNYLVMGVFNRRVAAMPDDFMQSYRQYFEKVVDDHQITAPNTLVQLFLNFRFFEPAGNMVLLVNLVAPSYILFMRMISSLLEDGLRNYRAIQHPCCVQVQAVFYPLKWVGTYWVLPGSPRKTRSSVTLSRKNQPKKHGRIFP